MDSEEHVGRAWGPGPSALETGCPCPKGPCGLVILGRADPLCDQHGAGTHRTFRHHHRGVDCPGGGRYYRLGRKARAEGAPNGQNIFRQGGMWPADTDPQVAMACSPAEAVRLVGELNAPRPAVGYPAAVDLLRPLADDMAALAAWLDARDLDLYADPSHVVAAVVEFLDSAR